MPPRHSRCWAQLCRVTFRQFEAELPCFSNLVFFWKHLAGPFHRRIYHYHGHSSTVEASFEGTSERIECKCCTRVLINHKLSFMALCQGASNNKTTPGSAEKQSSKPIQQAKPIQQVKPTKPRMSRQPEPVKQSDDEESESDKDESETEGGEEDTDDSDHDDEQAEDGVEDDNEEDDRDEQKDEDEEDEDEEDEDEENEDDGDEDDGDDDDDVDPNEEVGDKHEPPSEAAKVLRGQQSKVNGAQQPAKEVKEKAEQAAKVRSSKHRPLVVHSS